MALFNDDGSIDVEKIIRSKFPKAPGFVISYARKLFHEEWFNTFLTRGYEGVEFCDETIKFLNVKLEVEGLENIPEDGLYTFASNHPLGGIDGVALCSLIGNHLHTANDGVRFLVNDFLLALKGLNPVVVGVNKVGGQARALVEETNKLYADTETQVLIFPAGVCSRKIDGVVQDLPWTKSFVTLSKKYGRSIVPVHFYGENSKRFYRIANIQKKLKIKAPLAMALLPDELYKGRGKTFKVVFGKPIPPETFDSSKKPIEWAAYLRDKAYEL